MITSRRSSNRRFFALTELIVVIGILAILSSILLPNLRRARQQAKFARWLTYSRQLQNETVAYWDFREKEGAKLTNKAQGLTLKRYDPRQYDGQIRGNQRAWTEGRWPGKGALWFDGAFTYVDCGAHTGEFTSNPKGGDMTFGAWIYPYNLRRTVYVLDNGGSKRAYTGIVIALNRRSKGYFSYQTDTERYRTGFRVPLAQREWTQVVAVYDSGSRELRVYRNAQLVKTVKRRNRRKGRDHPNKRLMLGASYKGRRRFKGAIDEVFIANRAWTEQDIKSHYRMGKP